MQDHWDLEDRPQSALPGRLRPPSNDLGPTWVGGGVIGWPRPPLTGDRVEFLGLLLPSISQYDISLNLLSISASFFLSLIHSLQKIAIWWPSMYPRAPSLPLWGRMSCGPRETKYDRYNNMAKLSLNIIIHRHRYYIGLRHKYNTGELAQTGLNYYCTINCQLFMDFKLLKLHYMRMKVALNLIFVVILNLNLNWMGGLKVKTISCDVTMQAVMPQSNKRG